VRSLLLLARTGRPRLCSHALPPLLLESSLDSPLPSKFISCTLRIVLTDIDANCGKGSDGAFHARSCQKTARREGFFWQPRSNKMGDLEVLESRPAGVTSDVQNEDQNRQR
jgi:hypothetical protein